MANPQQSFIDTLIDTFGSSTENCDSMVDYFSYPDASTSLQACSWEEQQIQSFEETTPGLKDIDFLFAPDHSVSCPLPTTERRTSIGNALEMDTFLLDTPQATSLASTRNSSVSETKDQTTDQASAVSKRQAQNRAAQRNFRQRRLKYARELEDKVKHLTALKDNLQHDNEQLRSQLSEFLNTNVLSQIDLESFQPIEMLPSPPTTVKPAEPRSPASMPISPRCEQKQSNVESSVTAEEAWDQIRTHLLQVLLEANDLIGFCKRLRKPLSGESGGAK